MGSFRAKATSIPDNPDGSLEADLLAEAPPPTPHDATDCDFSKLGSFFGVLGFRVEGLGSLGFRV